jgi:hypothetical protein
VHRGAYAKVGVLARKFQTEYGAHCHIVFSPMPQKADPARYHNPVSYMPHPEVFMDDVRSAIACLKSVVKLSHPLDC